MDLKEEINGCLKPVFKRVDLLFISRMLSILKRHRPQGLDLMDVCLEYYKMFGLTLRPKDYQFPNVYEMCKEVEYESKGTVFVSEPEDNGLKTDRLFIDQNLYSQWLRQLKSEDDWMVLEDLVKPLLPKDVVLQHKTRLPFTKLPEQALKGLSIVAYSVDVVHVVTPNEIYVRLMRDSKTYHKIRSLMRFFDGIELLSDAYVLPEELVTIGYMCAVRNPLDWDNWHRAVIIGFAKEEVILYAIDFGNVIVEERQELRLLKASMFKDPALVIRVSLYGVTPIKGSNWSQESVDFLVNKTNYKPPKQKIRIKCAFLYNLSRLGTEVFAVTLFYDIEVNKEVIPNRLPIYLHEKLIQNGLAEMIFDDFNQMNASIISKPIETPLLAIKYEPDFNGNQSLSVKEEYQLNGQKEVEPQERRLEEKPTNNKKFFLSFCNTLEVLKIRQNTDLNDSLVERQLITENRLHSFDCFQFKHFDKTKSEQMLLHFRNKYNTGTDVKTKIEPKFAKEDESGCVRSLFFGNKFYEPIAVNEYSRELDSVFVKYLSR